MSPLKPGDTQPAAFESLIRSGIIVPVIRMHTSRSFFLSLVFVVACAAALPVADVPEDIEKRRNDDFETLQAFRPGYRFWQHIFTIPDGSIAFGSAIDGRLLAVFPTRGDWLRDAEWTDPSLANLLAGRRMPRSPEKRVAVKASNVKKGR